MKNLKIATVCAGLLSAFIALPAHATLTVYTDKAAFTTAAGSVTTETFSGATVGTSVSNYSGNFNGFSLSSVANGDKSGIATGAISNGDPVPAGFAGQPFYGWGEGNDGNVGPTTTFHFNHASTAFGFDWFNSDLTDAYSLTINSLSPTVFKSGSSGFFGVIASDGETFSQATIQTAYFGGFVSTEGLDNVMVGSSNVPEPASLALIGIAAAGLVTSRRKRTR